MSRFTPGSVQRLAATVAALVLAAIAPAASAAAADFVMKFGTATFNESQHQYIKFYKEALEKASNGRIEVGIYPRSELGPIPRMIDGLQLGTIEAYIGPADFYVGVDPRFGVLSTPMLFKNNDHASATVLDPRINEYLLSLGEAKGLVGLGTFGLGASNYAAKSPILRLADFSGKKLRVNATAMEREKMRRLGATAVPMPLNEVMPSLQRGVIDGTMSGTVGLCRVQVQRRGQDHHRHQRYHAGVACDGQQGVARQAAGRPAQDRDRDRPGDPGPDPQMGAGVHQGAGRQAWKELGGEIHALPPDDLAKMSELLESVGDDVSKDQPAVIDLLKKVREVTAKH